MYSEKYYRLYKTLADWFDDEFIDHNHDRVIDDAIRPVYEGFVKLRSALEQSQPDLFSSLRSKASDFPDLPPIPEGIEGLGEF
nr:hypothetical protein [Sphingomonas sp. Y57]